MHLSSKRVSSAPLVLLVRAYQWTLRPFIGAHCRFQPTCSDYAIAALHAHGPVRGTALSVRRVLRCNPWHAGGLDPVPPAACACRPASLPSRPRIGRTPEANHS